MAATKAADLAFGLAGEEAIKEQLSEFLGTQVMLQGGFAVLDVVANRKRGEIKSRREPLSYFQRFGTIIIGKNKIDAFTDPEIDYYCFFNLKDGLYYIKYDPDLFKDFRVETNYLRGARSDDTNRPQTIVHIPVELLKPVA